ncbi:MULTISPECIES: CaiB/BaiF CoA transferase family protein [Aliiruegeria]|uniref:Crotonobetainyl-CoA:carnitine CoA-transferase CaiB n=1 Tax=Aliiruegeria lutimaris TaxID=571298 RepID=A0A1G9JM47_9RHOB|nr:MULTISPECIES: CaiB/BaiF CoA-transferase family protein [Aliiruegeria]NDR56696.1 CoA transferase [Pseudoruegeria sp. M32A2M]SDL38174.1 Crotonobetainyl-CoA:carnitine CoA-transferase CaiB [Aliiruegeria lutimaris]
MTETPKTAPGAALSGLRVLDMTRILAGPWATQILADMGAEVIKIERPGVGDDTRSWGPPNVTDQQGRDRGAAYFHSANRSKKSVTVDMVRPEGQRVLKALAGRCDVVIENFKVGGLAKYGLDYASIEAIKPDIVYCSITGFGQTGPYANRAGYDFLIQAMGGLMSVTGQADGTPGAEPIKVGVALTDVLTGLYAVIGILSALRHRDATGEGQHIDMSLLDVQVATLANQAMNFLATGTSPGRLGNAHPSIVPYQAFAASDGHVILAVGNDGQFARFCEAAGAPGLATDERFATNPGRVRHRDVLIPILQGLMSGRSMDDWITTLNAANVPVGPINSIERVFADPHVRFRGLQTYPTTPDGDALVGVGSPLKLSRTPAVAPLAAPDLGADTGAVLSRLLDPSTFDLEALMADGTIGDTRAKPKAGGTP